ncbi:helix-turn-helix transcriptional regulator [Zhouia sp. PK063]|uniref:helix-turn-helix transcriptional regulator n=1 Tax=Zhouia sp. PK063 TaxID=3373602 RepID=UPI00378918C4
MSSNIQVNRICEYCGKKFIAKKTTTKYCSHKCNSHHYKQKVKDKKISSSNKETLRKEKINHTLLSSKEFLSIQDTCELLSVSRWTIWRRIKNNEIKFIKIGSRIIIPRKELNNYLKF